MKWYIDDHNSVSSDRYMRMTTEERKEIDRLAQQQKEREEMEIKNFGDKIRCMSLGDLLVKIQVGVNNNKCVMESLSNGFVRTCDKPDTVKCSECILRSINMKLPGD